MNRIICIYLFINGIGVKVLPIRCKNCPQGIEKLDTYFDFKYFTSTFLFNLNISCEVIIIISISLMVIWLYE